MGLARASCALEPFRQIVSACLMNDALEGWDEPPPQPASEAASARPASGTEIERKAFMDIYSSSGRFWFAAVELQLSCSSSRALMTLSCFAAASSCASRAEDGWRSCLRSFP